MIERSIHVPVATALLLVVIRAGGQNAEPATFTIDKHASYTVTTDGWPYAFLPDSGGFYLLVGGTDRAPKALRYDSTGRKGSPRTGIDLTRRSSDMAAWRLEDGRIFNTVFGPPDPNGDKPEEKDGEIIWGYVDPTKKLPAEPHSIGTVKNSDRAAPLGWSNSAFLSDGHHVFWVVPHLKKKLCGTLAIAIVDWRKGKAATLDVNLPVALENISVYQASSNDGGDVLFSLSGVDPSVKKDGWSEWVTVVLVVKADGSVQRTTVRVPDHYTGCVSCLLDNGGQATCTGFAVRNDKLGPAVVHGTFSPGQSGAVEWTIASLDEEATRQLCDRSRDMKELASDKADKPDPKARSLELSGLLAKLRPIHYGRNDRGDLLFVGELQVRNEMLGDQATGNQAGNIRDQLLYAVFPAAGTARIGVVRKFVVESGAPGYGNVPNTAVLHHGDRIYFFFNDWEKHEFAKGAKATDRFGRINVATLEGAGMFDPVVHVEGPEGPIERTAIQRSMQLDYMLNGCTVRCGHDAMLAALTKGRGIQWMKVRALP